MRAGLVALTILKAVTMVATMPFSSQAADLSAIELGDGFFPEGIAADNRNNLYVGSLDGFGIVRIDAETGRMETLVPGDSDGLASVLGLLAHDESNTLFACSADPTGNRGGAVVSALFAFNLMTGETRGRYDLPGGGLCNDLTRGDDGAIYVTDSFNPRILILKSGETALEPWIVSESFEGDGFNLNGIALINGGIDVTKYNSGELFRIPIRPDGSAGDIISIPLLRPLQAPDGLTVRSSSELLVVEGSGRLTSIRLKDGRAVLETLREGLDVPTTVAISGSVAWVVEGQLDHYFQPDDAGRPDIFRIQPVPLR